MAHSTSPPPQTRGGGFSVPWRRAITNVGFSTLSLVPDAHRFGVALPTAARASLGPAGKRGGGLFFASTLRAIGPLAAISAGLWVVGKVGGFFKDAVSGASELEQSVGAIETVFKGSAGQMLDWSNNAATAVGLTANEYNTLGTLIGTQLKNGGTATDELAGKTNDLIGVGADLSSMFGGTTSDAVSALSSALKGERDPIEAYGVSLNQAAVDAKAAELGFSKVGGALSTEANQAATLALIMDQTADAHGNFGRESDTLAHKQQVLNAMWENGKTKIGQALLPAVSGLASALIGVLGPSLDGAVTAINWVVDAFGGLGSTFGPVIGSMVSAFAPFVPQITGALSELVPAFASVLPSLSPFGVILQGLLPILPRLLPLVVEFATHLSGGLVDVHAQFVPLVAALGALFRQQFAAILPYLFQAAGLYGTVLRDVLVPAWTALLSALVPLVAALVAEVLPEFASLVAALLPALAASATLVGAVGPIVAALLGVLLPMVEALTPVVQAATSLMISVVTAALQIVQGLLQTATGLMSGDWAQVWSGLATILSGVWALVTGLLRGAVGVVVAVIGPGMSVVRSAWSAAVVALSGPFRALTDGLRSAIVEHVGVLVGFLATLGALAVSGLSGTGSWLHSVGRNIVEGLIEGVKAMTQRIADAVLGPIKGSVDAVKSFLGIHSPSRMMREHAADAVAESARNMHYVEPATAPSALFEPGPDAASTWNGRDFELSSTGSLRGDLRGVDFLIRTQKHAYAR